MILSSNFNIYTEVRISKLLELKTESINLEKQYFDVKKSKKKMVFDEFLSPIAFFLSLKIGMNIPKSILYFAQININHSNIVITSILIGDPY